MRGVKTSGGVVPDKKKVNRLLSLIGFPAKRGRPRIQGMNDCPNCGHVCPRCEHRREVDNARSLRRNAAKKCHLEHKSKIDVIAQ